VGDWTRERARALGRGRGRDGGLTDVESVLLHGLVHVSGGEVGWCGDRKTGGVWLEVLVFSARWTKGLEDTDWRIVYSLYSIE
jgi:hypothetical protein